MRCSRRIVEDHGEGAFWNHSEGHHLQVGSEDEGKTLGKAALSRDVPLTLSMAALAAWCTRASRAIEAL